MQPTPKAAQKLAFIGLAGLGAAEAVVVLFTKPKKSEVKISAGRS
jgi:hypothetical protein